MGYEAPIGRIRLAFAASLLVFCALALIGVWIGGISYLPIVFFSEQDLPVMTGVVALVLLGGWVDPDGRFLARLSRVHERILSVPWWIPITAAFLVAYAGATSILGTYPLSMDEYWARADGYALSSGYPMARIPAELAEYAQAMQPIFARISGDATYWASTYLPINALFQGLLGPVASPFFAAGAMWLLLLVAQRHMPAEANLPIFCLLFAATSAQWVVTGMTTYAMSAHLFFNLAWLVLVYRKGLGAQMLATAVGVLAIGLHQFAFFPVFAGFFILDLFLSGRRRVAVLQGMVILAGVIFWSMWNSLSYEIMGTVPPSGDGRQTFSTLDMLIYLLGRNDLSVIGVMGMNLVRFQLWQNPLLLPLAMLAVPIAWKLKGFWRACVLSTLATFIFMSVVIPYQGHGWGYRYLHHVLGNVILLASLAWVKLDYGASRAGRAAFAGAAVIGLILIPLRFYQAQSFVRPWADADRSITETDADIVLIDAPDHMFSNDLVRNLPSGGTGPIRMARGALSDEEIAALCRRYSIERFGPGDAERAGLPSANEAFLDDTESDPCSSS